LYTHHPNAALTAGQRHACEAQYAAAWITGLTVALSHNHNAGVKYCWTSQLNEA
jgi:hypothetical protein